MQHPLQNSNAKNCFFFLLSPFFFNERCFTQQQ